MPKLVAFLFITSSAYDLARRGDVKRKDISARCPSTKGGLKQRLASRKGDNGVISLSRISTGDGSEMLLKNSRTTLILKTVESLRLKVFLKEDESQIWLTLLMSAGKDCC